MKHSTHKLFTLVVTFFVATMMSYAIPAYNGKVIITQPDGSQVSCYIYGDETWHTFVSEDGYIMHRENDGYLRFVTTSNRRLTLNDIDEYRLLTHSSDVALSASEATGRVNGIKRAAKARNAAPYPNGNFPTTGSVKGLVLLVEFSDNAFNGSYTQTVFNGLMNTNGFNQFGAQGSARDYFVDQSMGVFTPQFDVVGPVKLTKTMAYYGADDDIGPDAKAGEMIADACRLADEQGIDFSQYDYNNDGLVDFVYVIYAGYGQNYGADANTVWPHTASLQDWEINLSLDGKQVGRYACSSELKYNNGTQLEGIGTFCHEFGHVLGLKDLYDTRHSNGTRVGVWSIMDQGCYNNESRTPCAYSAFERYSLGWLNFTDIDTPSEKMELAEITENNVAYRIRTANENEFFTLENRQQKGWDAYLPQKGLMIMHIDYKPEAWNNNAVNNGSVMCVDLVEADGVMSSDTYSTDLYPAAGNDKFTDTSSPNALSNDGQPTGKAVTQIRDVDGVITFRFMQEALNRPEAPIVDEVGANYVTCHWDEVDGAIGYRLDAIELLAADENPLAADENFDTMTAGAYLTPDNAEMGGVLDSYLSLEGWTGEKLRQAGGYLYIEEGGSLTSPLLDLSAGDTNFTVGLNCLSSGNQASFKIVAARNNGREITSSTAEVDGEATDVIANMTGGISRTRIIISAIEGGLYIDRLRVMKGTVAKENIWDDVLHHVVADNIATTSYTLYGLMPSKNYTLTLTALASDETLNSNPSPTVLITTAEGTGISSTSTQKVVKTVYYNLNGQTVSNPHTGVFIVKEITTDGKSIVKKVVKR